MITEKSIKEILRSAKVCIPDKEGNLHCWFGEGTVTVIDPESCTGIDFFSISPSFTAKPSLNKVITYIKRKIEMENPNEKFE